jgi:hypothetical protein
MILVCGGLADHVTELVCARLEHLRYEYRLLNLGLYPQGYRINWTWDNEVPEGMIVGSEWSLDLRDISGVFIRYVGMDGHAPFTSIPAEQPISAGEPGICGWMAMRRSPRFRLAWRKPL